MHLVRWGLQQDGWRCERSALCFLRKASGGVKGLRLYRMDERKIWRACPARDRPRPTTRCRLAKGIPSEDQNEIARSRQAQTTQIALILSLSRRPSHAIMKCMAKDEPKPKPPPEDPIQSALDAVERATGENLADSPEESHRDHTSSDDDTSPPIP